MRTGSYAPSTAGGEYHIWPCAHVAYKTERGDESAMTARPPRLGAMQLRLYQTLGGLADGPNGSAVVIPFPADLVRAFSRT